MKLLTVMNTASQSLAARLFSRGRTQADKQRGASALEYIVLAVAIVIVVGIGAAALSPEIESTFADLLEGLQGGPAGGGDPN
ncbi:MAG TPA: hypothetical protein EYG00_02115 [Alcanivorax sp.]|jgi:Flp pilus assembly pilin Flp|nr:hypothetical protein [Alcanivorax sp.]|tara:strand:+ start:602 stop:847 length:246 start_codon:yes stop_codon:yes gene_type:complete